MSNIYKIEAYSESSSKQLAEIILKSGGSCILRGWALVTDHVFSELQAQQALHLVAKISDNLTDDDIYAWSDNSRKAA